MLYNTNYMPHGNLGKIRSIETRQKISYSRIGKYGGKNNPRWQGGKRAIGGYLYVYAPDHPNKTKQGYVCEHRLIMEQVVGRYLDKNEVVHHINHIKTDNRAENLKLINDSEHKVLHAEGHPSGAKGTHWTPERREVQYRIKHERDSYGRFL